MKCKTDEEMAHNSNRKLCIIFIAFDLNAVSLLSIDCLINCFLFKKLTNNEVMIAPLEKCNIQDDNFAYSYGGKCFDGELFTVNKFKSVLLQSRDNNLQCTAFLEDPKNLSDKLMKQMNGHSTDYLYSSLPEEEKSKIKF